MPYEYLDDATTADVAFRATAGSLQELLITSAEALMNVMVEDLDTIEVRETRILEIADEPADLLLFELLQELIFFKDAESLLLRVTEIELSESSGGYSLAAHARGEPIEPDRHDMNVDVKAVTLHRFAVEEKDGVWEAFVIVDV